MERLIHGTGSFPGCCCGLLHTHQSADISNPTKNAQHNRKAVILTAQYHLISVLEVKNDITLYFCFRFSHFFLTNAAITFPCRFFSTTEDCSKCTEIKNQKSDVIALF